MGRLREATRRQNKVETRPTYRAGRAAGASPHVEHVVDVLYIGRMVSDATIDDALAAEVGHVPQKAIAQGDGSVRRGRPF